MIRDVVHRAEKLRRRRGRQIRRWGYRGCSVIFFITAAMHFVAGYDWPDRWILEAFIAILLWEKSEGKV